MVPALSLRGRIRELSRYRSVRQLYAALSNAPLLGPSLRKLVSEVIPNQTRIWLRISFGSNKKLWARLDPRFEMVYAEGQYEAAVQRALCAHLKPGSVFYDIG